MSDPELTLEQRELAYYKRQVDTLAGESLRLEYTISGLRHDLRQKRQGFALLSQLQEAIGAHKQVSSIFSIALPAIGATLGIDKAIVLTPTNREHRFRATQSIGIRQDAAQKLEAVDFDVPPELATGMERLIVNKASLTTPFVEHIQSAFELPFFVCVPVLIDQRPIALLVAGRLRESKPLYPPLDQGDLDTFVAITGLISASIRNMQVGVLEEMDRLKTQFFANISHEFRTPITLTLGPLEQLLNERYGEIGDEVRDQLRIMRRNQERLLVLVNQILDLAKLEAGEMRLRAARTPEINRLVAAVAAQFEAAAADRGVALRLSRAPVAAGVDLYVDREKFERLLVNLLSNALKFTKQGHIEIATDVEADVFRLTVSDTGIGIKEDQLPHIFDRFRQADGSESREYAGTGIGLSLVKEIAGLHGGHVTANSRHGEGTTFQVTLPLGSAHLDAASIVEPSDASDPVVPRIAMAVVDEGASDREGAATANRDAEASFDASRPTLLYAEDNPDLRRHVKDLLRRSYNVFLASDGRDALEKIRAYHPDLVLSDQMMPNMSGPDLLRAMREDPDLRATPVIILTARAGTEARIESLEAGADDYLTKPFNEGELLARVRNLLRVRAQERELAQLNARLTARIEEQVAELVRGGELQRFVPRAVAERVLSGALGNAEQFERRKITVLSIAAVGLAELTESLEPEDLSATINDLFRELTASAVKHGGTVDRLTTEGVIVLFGAPDDMPLADQAWAAVQTAIEMRRGISHLGAQWRRRGIAGTLRTRVGMDTGYCTVGVFGSEVLRNYTAVGTPVALAALLQEDAAPGSIVCGATTFRLVEERVSAVPRGARELHGVARPVESFELTETVSVESATLPRLRDFSFIPR
jgi:signal transduction histidine kinase/class 3 adenylate cyclase